VCCGHNMFPAKKSEQQGAKMNLFSSEVIVWYSGVVARRGRKSHVHIVPRIILLYSDMGISVYRDIFIYRVYKTRYAVWILFFSFFLGPRNSYGRSSRCAIHHALWSAGPLLRGPCGSKTHYVVPIKRKSLAHNHLRLPNKVVYFLHLFNDVFHYQSTILF